MAYRPTWPIGPQTTLVKIIIESEYLLIHSNKGEKAVNWECVNLKYVLEIDTKTAIK